MKEELTKKYPTINGNLITGGIGTGKTTLIAYEIQKLLQQNPKLRLLAVGSDELFSKIPNDFFLKFADKLSEDSPHKLIKVNFHAFTNIKPSADKFMEILRKAVCEEKDFLIAVDVPTHFFADSTMRSEFAKLMEKANTDRKKIFLMMTCYQIEVYEALFGADFPQNFRTYTLLQNIRTDEFYRKNFGLETRQIKKGEGHQLQKDAESGKYLFPSGYSQSKPIIIFQPGIVKSVKYAPPERKWRLFSSIVGLYRRFRNYSQQYNISH